MKTPAPADLHRWSEELARNPASLAFLPLARAYRRLGRRDLALQLCLRGLQHHPNHVEAHALLALLHFEAGDRGKAADEWAIVLRLKPGNFEALRGMGFRHLEQGDIPRARQHLERAALIRPDDTTVQEALRLIRQREAASMAKPATRPAPPPAPRAVAPRPAPAPPPRVEPPPPPEPTIELTADDALPEIELEPWSEPATPPAPPPAPARPAVRAPWDAPPPPHREPPPPPRPTQPFELVPSGVMPPDPSTVFDSLMGQGPLVGILLLDRRGLVMAGSIQGARAGMAEDLGAVLGGAIDEAVRTVTHLELGRWKSVLLECEVALLHVAPAAGDTLLVVAARRDAPTGWILRTAAQALTVAGRFAEVYS